jgi:hypothetical protein
MAYHGGLLAPLYVPSLASDAAREMAEDGREATMGYAAEFTPVNTNPFSSPGRAPGTLKAAWRKRGPITRGVRRAHPAYTGEYENPDPIAPFVENDTRAHLIRPRLDRAPASVVATKKPRRMGDDPQAALTWLTIGGVRVFARVVKHPGTTGQHMTLRAAARAEVEMRRICQPALSAWAKRAVRGAIKANAGRRIPGGGFS